MPVYRAKTNIDARERTLASFAVWKVKIYYTDKPNKSATKYVYIYIFREFREKLITAVAIERAELVLYMPRRRKKKRNVARTRERRAHGARKSRRQDRRAR